MNLQKSQKKHSLGDITNDFRPINRRDSEKAFSGYQQPQSTVANMPNAPHQHSTRYMTRYTPYYMRTYATVMQMQPPTARFGHPTAFGTNEFGNGRQGSVDMGSSSRGSTSSRSRSLSGDDAGAASSCVTLQVSNLDTSIDERILKQHLINRLKSITPVLSIYFETVSVAKIKLSSSKHARQAIAILHRKKIGHKRISVAETRESSSMEPSTLRCQVAGLLKDIPNYKLSMYKFRELFQSRFKTSISVTDLYEMKDICSISEEKNEEKFISLRPDLINSIENGELIDWLKHSVPYCSVHIVKSHRGWAEQGVDTLPNVMMTFNEVRCILYELLKKHDGDIPIATMVHCIQAELQVQLARDDQGVNFEHLISCVPGIQIGSNKCGIKILCWSNSENARDSPADEVASTGRLSRFGNVQDPLDQISRETVELIKMWPKSTLKFSRFIPAYHNHFGKQCRVADYGYTKLIDLFEALSKVVQVMGDGENRQVTLTHKTQVRRFSSDLMRILRAQSTKSIMLSQLSQLFENSQGRKFDITDYGVCDIQDILTGMAISNTVVVNRIPQMMDIMVSIPKRKQSAVEVEKTSIFAGEVVELFKRAAQFSIPFEKFACSYHYQFGYQCRLCDYGFSKLADLMESICGLVEVSNRQIDYFPFASFMALDFQMEFSNEEDRKIFLSPKIAQRIFSEQLKSMADTFGASDMIVNLHEVLVLHKEEFGYQIMPQSLGFNDMFDCIRALPYIEVIIPSYIIYILLFAHPYHCEFCTSISITKAITHNGLLFIKCHHDDQHFRQKCYAACRIFLEANQQALPMSEFVTIFASKYNETLNDRLIESMNHAIEVISFIFIFNYFVTWSMKHVFLAHRLSMSMVRNVSPSAKC